MDSPSGYSRIADRLNENISANICYLLNSFSSAARVTRCHARRLVCVRSMPPRSSVSSSSLTTILDSPPAASGQRKCPLSRRLAHTHSPLPSPEKQLQTIALSIREQEHVPTQRLHANRSRTARRVLQNLPHVRRPSGKIDSGGGADTKHAQACSRTVIS